MSIYYVAAVAKCFAKLLLEEQEEHKLTIKKLEKAEHDRERYKRRIEYLNRECECLRKSLKEERDLKSKREGN